MDNLPPTNSPNLESQRWQRIEEIFQCANSLPPQTRGEFLAQACGEDEALRREVESLLAVQSDAAAYFKGSESKPPAPFGAPFPNAQPAADELAANRWQLRLTIFAVVVIGSLTLALGGLILKYGWIERYGIWLDRQGDHFQFVDVHGPTNQGKLKKGDLILAINGERQLSRTHYWVVLRRIAINGTCHFLILRDGVEQVVEINPAEFPHSPLTRWRMFIFGWLRGVAFLSVALLIASLRRADTFSRLGIASYLALSILSLWIVRFHLQGQLTGIEELVELPVLLLNAGILFIPLTYHFALLFPPGARLPVSRFWLWLRNLLYAISLLLVLPSWLYNLAPFSDTLTRFTFAHRWLLVDILYVGAISWYYPFGLFCFCAVLLRNFRLVSEPAERRRLKLVIYGTLATVFPVAMLAVSEGINKTLGYGSHLKWHAINEAAVWITDTTSLGLPFIWGYAILTQRVYDVRVVIRRGMQYLLARNVLRVALALPLLLAAWHIASQPDQTIRQLILAQPLTLVLIALAALSLAFRQQLRTGLDRRFFREQYRQEQVLYQLLNEIGGYDDLPALCQRVEQTLTETLHPQRLLFFLRQAPTRALHLVQTVSQPAAANANNGSLSDSSALYQLLKNANEPLAFPLPHGTVLPPHEAQQLTAWQTCLLVPLHDSQAHLAGVLLLGEKRSEEPYSPTDRRLLAALAQQMAMVVEVTQLRGQVVQQAQTEHTVLARLAADEINLLRECPHCGACYGVEANQCANCDTALALTMPIERVIEGRYQLEQLIGRGGMGVVYRANDQRLRRAVAVKILKADFFGDAALLRRFEKEALAIARLDHRNIVRVYDSGTTAAGGAWLVMELLTGISLREALQRQGRFSLPEVAHWFEQLLAALQAAHQAGVIHRDLKPENILLLTEKPESEARQHQLKILDFGLAKLHTALADSQAASAATVAGMLVGTFAYMAPEQFEGKAVDERADIYSLTLILLEVLTGLRPPAQTRSSADFEEFMKSLTPTYSELLPLLRKGLSAEARHRYTTIEALRNDFIALASKITAP